MKILFLGKAQSSARVVALQKYLGRHHDVRGRGLRQPSAIHMHGWRWTSLAVLLRMSLPNVVLVWTVESWPTRWESLARFILWQAGRAGVEIVATTRALQWRILTAAGVRVRYIPDGYEVAEIPPISVRRFGLWGGRYTAAVASTPEEMAWVKRAYARMKTRKKLVFVNEVSGGRAERSLLSGAAAIILASTETPSATVLSAMESGRPIVAVAAPLLEELLGVTATFIAPRAEDELTQALASLKTTFKAQRRARAHFTWERIFAEYGPLYHEAVFTVPLDSARGILKATPGW